MDLLVTLFYDLFCKQKYVDTIMQREEQTNKPGKVDLCPRYPGSQADLKELMMQNNLKLNSCGYNYSLTAGSVSPHK